MAGGRMTEMPTTEAPIMLRADITRAELKNLKRRALEYDKTVQQFLAELIRKELGA
jgi:hypothetical protein